MSKVSVIIPVYKVEEYLNKCMESILLQKFQDIEIILVDDGSVDKSGAMCDEFAQSREFANIPVYVIHQINGGLSAARNSGIDWTMACSESEWLCFVDSDDTISDMYIEKLYEAAVSNNADLAICDFMEVDTEGNDIHKPHNFPSKVHVEKNKLFETMHSSWRTHTAWNKLYHRHIFEELRFDKGRLHEDEFIIHKVLFLSNKVVFVPQMLYFYLIRSSGIMGTEDRQIRADFYMAEISRYWYCKEHSLPFDPWVLGVGYMTIIRDFNYVEVTKKHKEMYFDYPSNRLFRKKLAYYFFPIYKRYRKWRLDK